jgi:very-short-patch-repair endonuclease
VRVFSGPFRGSVAVAAGSVTAHRLRGPRFRRLFQDVYVAAQVEVDLALRARAAYLLVAGHGALGGWSAAELLGASCGPADPPAEVITPFRRRRQPGLVVRQERLPPDEITELSGPVVVTTALRTAFDLARRAPLLDAVIAVDALAHAFGFDPAEILRLDRRHLGARGSAQLPEVLRLADPLASSPMETRIRLAVIADRLPLPVLQHPVGPYLLDLAYPVIRLAIEYDGREHRTQQRAMRDLDRQAYLSTQGWTVLRFRAAEVYRPDLVASRVRGVLIGFARRRDSSLPELIALIDSAEPVNPARSARPAGTP